MTPLAYWIGRPARTVIAVASLAVACGSCGRSGDQDQVATPALRGSNAPLTIAATGDSLIVKPWPEAGKDTGFDDVVALLQRASLAITNLEQVLRDPSTSARPNGWPVGSLSSARALQHAGFTVATRANNHAADEGENGLRATSDVLGKAGLLHAGAGNDLDQARAPVVVGDSPRRVAVVAVTASATDEAHATRTRDEIRGRPGVSALRYSAEITADALTYAALAQLPQAEHASGDPASSFRLAGRLVKRGSATAVNLIADQRDVDDILNTITAARARADVVVVSVHSHEPGNLSDAPAAFVREFAHQAIDRGATIITGSGPRQLRGIEIYKGGVILYSLGNFAFDAATIPLNAGDDYDANTNLIEQAIGSSAPGAIRALPSFDEPIWWESVIATLTFDGSAVAGIRLHPIDLGTQLSVSERGRPRLATSTRGLEILQRLAELSKAYGTTMRIENGVGVIDRP